MPDYKIVDAEKLDADLKRIADKIREKNNTNENLAFPDDFITSIGDDDGIIKLRSVLSGTISELGVEDFAGIFSVRDYALSHTSLTHVAFHNDVTELGNEALSHCEYLLDVTIPTSVISCGSNVVVNCPQLKSVYYTGSLSQWLGMQFASGLCSNGSDLYFGDTLVDNIVVPDGTTDICDYAFSGCVSLTSINIPRSITYIGVAAFEQCTSLTDIYFDGTDVDWNNIVGVDSSLIPSTTIIHYTDTIGGDDELDTPIEPTEPETPSVEYSVGLTTESLGDGTCYVYNVGSCTDTIINIPPTSAGNVVTGIAWGAFSKCSNVTSIIIPNTVTLIEDSAFDSCTSLESITIPDGVKKIGDWTFYGCTSLKNVTIPSSVTKIGDDAFYGCASLTDVYYKGTAEQWLAISISSGNTSLTNATIHYNYSSDDSEPTEPEEPEISYSVGLKFINNGDGTCEVSGIGSCTDTDVNIPPTSPDGSCVTSISNEAFRSCSSLTSVVIPDSVKSIGYDAFYGCTSLASITLSDSVESIGGSAFYNTLYYNTESNWKDDVLYIDKCLIKANSTLSGDFIIPDNTVCVASGAFYNCEGITSIVIPEGIKCIGASTFQECQSLETITIPASVRSIGSYAFSWCNAISTVYYTGDVSSWLSILFEDNPLMKTETFVNLYFNGKLLTDLVIPDGITSIVTHAFQNCYSLTSVTIPDSVTSIGSYAFYNCASLASVTIPTRVTSIDYSAFEWCNSLTDVYYAGTEEEWNAISIGSLNERITNATIHYNCNGNEEPEVPDTPESPSEPEISYTEGLYFTDNGDGTCSVRGPYEGTYLNIPPTSPAGSIVTSIKADGFSDQTDIVTIIIPDSVTSIGNNAFASCNRLEYVTLSNNTTNIGDGAFRNCDLIVSINIPNSVTNIGNRAFGGCTKLTDVYYAGTEEEWNAISIGDGNENLTNASIHYSY